MPILPLVNNNGTSRNELVQQRRTVCKYLRASINSLREMAPHGRDYQTDPTGTQFSLACQHHLRRLVALEQLLADVEAEAIKLYEDGLK
jgi:hypothetical protein